MNIEGKDETEGIIDLTAWMSGSAREPAKRPRLLNEVIDDPDSFVIFSSRLQCMACAGGGAHALDEPRHQTLKHLIHVAKPPCDSSLDRGTAAFNALGNAWPVQRIEVLLTYVMEIFFKLFTALGHGRFGPGVWGACTSPDAARSLQNDAIGNGTYVRLHASDIRPAHQTPKLGHT